MFEIARVKCIENIVEKRRNCSTQYFYIGTRFSLRGKRLFEISQIEVMRVDCISVPLKYLKQALLSLYSILLICYNPFPLKSNKTMVSESALPYIKSA